ncbi:ATP-binding protein [Tomitella cavernea]|uniref:ATP-binding protein n=1 Tax=Tomitella cavernea TaxID=1387982 RepID=A0ABP9CYK9_9ACTN
MSVRDDAVRDHSVEALRVTALLRVPLLLIMVMVGTAVPVDHWLPGLYWGLLAFWALVAVWWLWLVWRGRVARWALGVSTAVDIVGLVSLCAASGGATSVLVPVFFVLPVAAAFLHGPRITAALGVLTVAGFVLVWLFYAVRDDTVDLPDVAFLYAAFLAWLAAAMTALSAVLERRSAAVMELLTARRKLVAEALRVEERERQRLAEHLHDGPLQNILAARMDVEEASERHPDPALEGAESILRDTAGQLRATVTTLNPQVLEHLGLAAALRELVDQSARRGGFETQVEIDGVGRPAEQALLYSTARELLANVVKHARADRVTVSLGQSGRFMEMTVADDGAGFDRGMLPERIAEGHIGLASHVLRIESVGGTWEMDSAPGRGTTTVVRVPRAGHGVVEG